MARGPLVDLRAVRAPRKQTTGPSRRSSRWSQRAPGKKDKPPGVQGVNHLRDVIRRAFKGCDRRSTDVMAGVEVNRDWPALRTSAGRGIAATVAGMNRAQGRWPQYG